jgi:hypothetical protein
MIGASPNPVETSADAMLVDPSHAFSALSSDERRHLRQWQVAARAIGVDAVEDLTLRPWPCTVAWAVIGVFTARSKAAHWLVVGDDDAWAVAYCGQGEVSRTLESLAEALALIYPGVAAAGQSQPVNESVA